MHISESQEALDVTTKKNQEMDNSHGSLGTYYIQCWSLGKLTASKAWSQEEYPIKHE